MTHVGQARESFARHSARGNTVQIKLASKHNKLQGAVFAPSVLGEQSNALLVAAAQSGLNEAFEVLVRRHQARILSVALRFTRNREDAEDITQQTLQKAFLHLRRFQGNSSFSTWLTRIAINEALMWSRRKWVSSEVPLEVLNVNDESHAQLDPPDFVPNPEETCLRLERQRIVSAAINSLTPKLRRAMQLREFAELSTKETAALMRVSVGTIKARLFHGRTKLRTILNQYVGPKQTLVPSHKASSVALNSSSLSVNRR